jgi:hypothetical protein
MAVRFEASTYPGGVVYAYYDGTYDSFASLTPCPLGIAVRWFFIDSGRRGANEIVPTIEAAKQLVEDWVRGMEIEPWP